MCMLLLLLLAHNTQKCEMIEIVLEYVCFFSLLLLLRMFDMRVNKKSHSQNETEANASNGFVMILLLRHRLHVFFSRRKIGFS